MNPSENVRADMFGRGVVPNWLTCGVGIITPADRNSSRLVQGEPHKGERLTRKAFVARLWKQY